MRDITIQVRSPFQKAILEVLWSMDTLEQVLAFRDSLPNPQQRAICTAMIELLAVEYIDQQITQAEDCDQARAVIAQIKQGH